MGVAMGMDMSRYPGLMKLGMRGLFPCYRCSFQAVTQREHEDHQEFHRQEWHMCAVCEKQFPAVDELNVHFASKHAEVLHERCLSEREREDFKNRIRLDNTPESILLYRYLTVPRDSSKLYCVVCSLYYTWESDMARHFDENHQGLPNPYRKRPRVEDGEKLQDHKRMRFMDSDVLQCGQCSFTARDPGELKRHFLVHSLNRPFACTMCGYSTRWKHDLQQHVQRYHGEPHAEQPEHMAPHRMDAAAPAPPAGHDNSNSQPIRVPELSAIVKRDSQPEPAPTHVLPKLDDDSSGSDEEKTQYLSSLGLYSNNSPISYKKKADNSPTAIKNTDMPAMQLPAGKPSPLPGTPPKPVIESPSRKSKGSTTPKSDRSNGSAETILPYKCNVCEYRARWPSEIAQHMKNHSDEKPFHCPRCSYKSKWKWDVVKHLKRCGGGTVKDVIDTTKDMKDGGNN